MFNDDEEDGVEASVDEERVEIDPGVGGGIDAEPELSDVGVSSRAILECAAMLRTLGSDRNCSEPADSYYVDCTHVYSTETYATSATRCYT